MFSSNMDSLGYQSFKGASWALVSGLHLGDTIKGLTLVLGPLFNPAAWACVWAYVMGLHAHYFEPHQLPPQPLTKASVGEGCIASQIKRNSHMAIQEGFD